jgi:PAS domain S-box-containing protein
LFFEGNDLQGDKGRLESILNAIADGITLAGLDGKITDCNEASLTLLGLNREELIGKKVFDIVIPEDRQRAIQEVLKVLETSKNLIEVEVLRKNGNIFQAEISVTLLLDKTGKPFGFLGVLRDISKRKQVEEASRESEERYRTLFSRIGEAFALHEMLFDSQSVPYDYRFLEVNGAFEKQTGLLANEIVGKTVREVLPDLEPFWIETYGKVVITGVPVRFENYNQSLNRFYEVYAFRPVLGRFAVIFTDITERVRLRQKLEEYAKNLEMLVEQRTKQLKDAERLAAIGSTAGMVGHDIRNPLQAMISDAYLLRSELTSTPECASKEGITESLESIENNIAYIDKIVSDLQDYTRTLKPDFREVNVKDLINSTLAVAKAPKRIKTSIVVDERFILSTDATYLRRILTNLILNAVQAIPDEGKLTIEAYKEKDKVIIGIKDTGVGIPEKIKPKLFTPLFTTKAKGQGLGLAVVKHLIEGLNGKISFESEEGKGTKFIIELPLTN